MISDFNAFLRADGRRVVLADSAAARVRGTLAVVETAEAAAAVVEDISVAVVLQTWSCMSLEHSFAAVQATQDAEEHGYQIVMDPWTRNNYQPAQTLGAVVMPFPLLVEHVHLFLRSPSFPELLPSASAWLHYLTKSSVPLDH